MAKIGDELSTKIKRMSLFNMFTSSNSAYMYIYYRNRIMSLRLHRIEANYTALTHLLSQFCLTILLNQ